jgi:hypothetical protein
MTQIPTELFEQVKSLASKVKQDLRKQGIVIPVKNKDGSVTVGNYKIIKKDVFYYIVDRWNEPITQGINLPQTAILVANKLALGRLMDDRLLKNDQYFGWKSFDQESYTRSAKSRMKRNMGDAEIYLNRADIAKREKNYYKSVIMSEYERLRRAT